MNNDNLTEKESLQIIEDMFDKTNNKIDRRIANNCIICGSVSIVVCLLSLLGYSLDLFVFKYSWVILPILISAIISFYRNFEFRKTGYVKKDNYSGIGLVWIIVYTMCMLFFLLALTVNLCSYGIVYIMFLGIGFLYTYKTIRFNLGVVLTSMGILCGFANTIISKSHFNITLLILLFILSIMLMSVIPGYMLLNRKYKNR